MTSSKLVVINLVLDTGERLPCLVDEQTWIPVRLATRWAVRYRRYRVQSSTLASNLRVLSKIYDWAWHVVGVDLDTYLTNGQLLTGKHLESLVAHLRENARSRDGSQIAPNTYNVYLAVAEDFLKWSLYADNRGGTSTLPLDELTEVRTRLELFFKSVKVRGDDSSRIQPLTAEDMIAIRTAIAPVEDAKGQWVFPKNGFSPQTALRNWLMFETACELGIRRGELLKLRLDCLPRGREESIIVRRFPDDPHDSRTYEPAVKSAERKIPASRQLLQTIRVYVTLSPPMGRVSGKSPYLFVTRSGDPLSIHMAQDIIRAIGRHSDVSPLSWHRLRHTWAEKMADILLDQANGLDVLMYLGGWQHPASPKRYIQNALTRKSASLLRQYQDELYAEGETE